MRKSTTCSILQHILVTTIATTTLVACGDSGIDTDGYGALPCRMPTLSDYSPPAPIDYFESQGRDPLYGDPDAKWETTYKIGSPCATATNEAACLAAIAAPYEGDGLGSFGICGGSCGDVAFLVNRGDEVRMLGTVAEVKDVMLGVIDTPHEADLIVSMAGYSSACGESENGGVRAIEDGYELLAMNRVGDCNSRTEVRYRLSVSRNGTVQVLESEDIKTYETACY